jgi:glutaminase
VIGDGLVPFSTQSLSKVFALMLAMSALGEGLWERVRREPSGRAFDSLEQLESERGLPRNPFVNAGALVVTDILLGHHGGAVQRIVELLRTESQNPEIHVDEIVAASEMQHGHRNAGIANVMKSFGTITNPVAAVTTDYFRQCAISASCRDLSLAALVLARHGTLRNGTELLTPSAARQVSALMLTCGTYDAAGDVASRVGLPCKSGVGGGLLAVIPGVGALTVWSPRIDRAGTSVAGLHFLERFAQRADCSIF